jgi:hypothetical protein
VGLSEADKDRIAEIAHRVADRVARGEDQALEQELGGLTSEEREFAITLMGASVAHREEHHEAERDALERARVALDQLHELLNARGAPKDLTMGELVRRGFLTYEESEAVRRAMEGI